MPPKDAKGKSKPKLSPDDAGPSGKGNRPRALSALSIVSPPDSASTSSHELSKATRHRRDCRLILVIRSD